MPGLDLAGNKSGDRRSQPKTELVQGAGFPSALEKRSVFGS
ncbi:MAG: hypothetical protein WBM44_10760 [Waterburya sp.]